MTRMMSPIAMLCLVKSTPNSFEHELDGLARAGRAARSVRADSVNACGVYMLHLLPWDCDGMGRRHTRETPNDGL